MTNSITSYSYDKTFSTAQDENVIKGISKQNKGPTFKAIL